jgi:hypothetical protein
VTWAGEDVLFRAVKYRASGVRAEAAEREKRAVGWMQQEAGMLVVRVRDNFYAPHGDVRYVRHYLNRVGILASANEDDKTAESCG